MEATTDQLYQLIRIQSENMELMSDIIYAQGNKIEELEQDLCYYDELDEE